MKPRKVISVTIPKPKIVYNSGTERRKSLLSTIWKIKTYLPK
jgi:hypothetical protein